MKVLATNEIAEVSGGDALSAACQAGYTTTGAAFGSYFFGVPGLIGGAMIGSAIGTYLC